jgi:hypothetical protein
VTSELSVGLKHAVIVMSEVLKLSTISQMKKATTRPSSASTFRVNVEPKLCMSILSAAKAREIIEEAARTKAVKRHPTVNRRESLVVRGVERTLTFQLGVNDKKEALASVKEPTSAKLRASELDRTMLSLTTASFESNEANEVVRHWQHKLRACVTPNSRRPQATSAWLSDQEITRGLKLCFGSGFSRGLRPGERAVLISVIKESSSESWQAGLSDSFLVILLKRSRMPYLARYPLCVKQIYSLWKTEHVKDSHASGTAAADPVLKQFESADELTKKQFRPLSALYRKHLKYI